MKSGITCAFPHKRPFAGYANTLDSFSGPLALMLHKNDGNFFIRHNGWWNYNGHSIFYDNSN